MLKYALLGERALLPKFSRLLLAVRQNRQFCVGKAFGFLLEFILLFISVFHKGWERAHSAGVYSCGVFLFRIPFPLALSLTANAAAWKASGHLDALGAEVNLWIVLVQPGEAEYHTLLAKLGDSKQDAFGVLVVGHDHIDHFVNAPSLVGSSVHIVNRNWLGQFAGRKFSVGDEVLVDKVSSGAGVDYCFRG